MFRSIDRLLPFGVAAFGVSLCVAGCSSDESSASQPDGSPSTGGVSGMAGSSAGGGAGTGSGGSSSGGVTASGGASSGGASSGGASSGGASTGGVTSGSGGNGGASCAPVSFHMNRGGPPPGTDFCSGPPNCADGDQFGVLDGSSNALTIGLSCGMTDCSTCLSTPCPPGSCHFSSPISAAGMDFTWDGTAYARVTGCGNGGIAVACYSAHCAPPGHYVARMCAYELPPSSDDGTQVCELHASSTPTCVDVPFDYPPAAPVVGVLDPRK